MIDLSVRHFYTNRIRWLMERAEECIREANEVAQPMAAALLRKAASYETDARFFQSLLNAKPDEESDA